ncbi:uncharacterized protein LOC119664454 [Teleopsis dalmanni]|uniref:uncharacterized protein LOC119664454 n=1 Tax=Teleopsis dalmanni TaxID=139649 RepID=UPI0018CDBAB1|nr:uncharacterized protein LOC119664454 [Teleopsis dalmanni]
MIATGVPRGNGQVERINKTVSGLLTKLCINSSANWYKFVGRVQQFINNIPPKSTKHAPFKILTGFDMRTQDSLGLREWVDDEYRLELDRQRDEIRNEAKINISKLQEANRRGFDRGRVREQEYKIGELVAIKRTQLGTGMKLRPKFLGPYRIVEKLGKGRYKVEKVGENEGPNNTNSAAENMKKWGHSGRMTC